MEVTMVAELSIVTEWLPEQMEPGSIFVLENAGTVGDQDDPYWAVLSCPECGTLIRAPREPAERASAP